MSKRGEESEGRGEGKQRDCGRGNTRCVGEKRKQVARRTGYGPSEISLSIASQLLGVAMGEGSGRQ